MAWQDSGHCRGIAALGRYWGDAEHSRSGSTLPSLHSVGGQVAAAPPPGKVPGPWGSERAQGGPQIKDGAQAPAQPGQHLQLQYRGLHRVMRVGNEVP